MTNTQKVRSIDDVILEFEKSSKRSRIIGNALLGFGIGISLIFSASFTNIAVVVGVIATLITSIAFVIKIRSDKSKILLDDALESLDEKKLQSLRNQLEGLTKSEVSSGSVDSIVMEVTGSRSPSSD